MIFWTYFSLISSWNIDQRLFWSPWLMPLPRNEQGTSDPASDPASTALFLSSLLCYCSLYPPESPLTLGLRGTVLQ